LVSTRFVGLGCTPRSATDGLHSKILTDVGLHPKTTTHDELLQKHKGRLSGSLDVSNRGAMDRMMSTPLAAKERGITHRISKDRADFWKEEQNQPKDKKDNHTGLLTHSMPARHCASHEQHAYNTLCLKRTGM